MPSLPSLCQLHSKTTQDLVNHGFLSLYRCNICLSDRMQVNGYFSHVHSFPREWTRASKSNSHKRQHALIDLAFCYRHCFNKALAFFLEMSINDTQHLISKISLHKVDNAAPSLKHRICWSFPIIISMSSIPKL